MSNDAELRYKIYETEQYFYGHMSAARSLALQGLDARPQLKKAQGCVRKMEKLNGDKARELSDYMLKHVEVKK